MRNKRRAADFHVQTNPDAFRADTGEFNDLPVYHIPLGDVSSRKSKKTVLVPTVAYRFKINLNWLHLPSLVVVDEGRFWKVYDYPSGLGLPQGFGETKEEAINAGHAVLEQVGEKRYWKAQRANIELMRKANAPVNGEKKPTATEREIPSFSRASQPSLFG